MPVPVQTRQDPRRQPLRETEASKVLTLGQTIQVGPFAATDTVYIQVYVVSVCIMYTPTPAAAQS
jgi:hypothetical protein